MHPHRDIEGPTYFAVGTFRHADSLSNGGIFPARLCTADDAGLRCQPLGAERLETEPMRFIQLWIMPRELGLPPSVEQKELTKADHTACLLRAIGRTAKVPACSSTRTRRCTSGTWKPGKSVEHDFRPDFGG